MNDIADFVARVGVPAAIALIAVLRIDATLGRIEIALQRLIDRVEALNENTRRLHDPLP